MGMVLILVFVGICFLNFLAKQINIANYKSYDRSAQEIAKKYGGKGYPNVHLYKHDTTPETWAKYEAEVAELSRRHGY